MAYIARTMPCPGFPVSITYTDVEPQVLADEEARERFRHAAPPAAGWQNYLRRVLPALERGSANEMAQALLTAGNAVSTAGGHAETMRRRALAAGDVRRARFWADVTDALNAG